MQGPFGIPGDGPIQRFEAQERRGWTSRGHISGLTLSNDGTDATNDVGIAAGVARSTCRIIDGTPSTADRDQMDLELPVAVIKQADVLHAPDNYDASVDPAQGSGDRSGGRSSSSLADGSWHALLVGGPGIATDIILHDGATQALILPELQKAGGYTAYRRIGSVTRSTSIRTFTQNNDEFLFLAQTACVSVSNPGTSAVLFTVVGVPAGVKMLARMQGYFTFQTTGSGHGLLTSPDQTDVAASASSFTTFSRTAADPGTFQKNTRTNTSAQLRYRLSASSGSDGAVILCEGYIDQRDKDA